MLHGQVAPSKTEITVKLLPLTQQRWDSPVSELPNRQGMAKLHPGNLFN